MKLTRVYRCRPNGRDVDSAIMEVYELDMVLRDGPRSVASPLRLLSVHEGWSDPLELGGLVVIADQDMGNLSYVQEG
jgi:hypothetical protein